MFGQPLWFVIAVGVGLGLVAFGAGWLLLRRFVMLRVLLGAAFGGAAGLAAFWWLPDGFEWLAAQTGKAATADPTVRAVAGVVGLAAGLVVGSIAAATAVLVKAASQPFVVEPTPRHR